MIHVSGSIAIDTIMVFQGRFKDHILPDQVHMLNVAFLAPELRQEFGGCAANIAYGLRQLGRDVAVVGSIGHDGESYLQRMLDLGIDCESVVRVGDQFTAQAFITTDLDDNQITAFHPGAMNEAHRALVRRRGAVLTQPAGIEIGIVSPNGKAAMQGHARAFAEAGIPFVFDPGQAMPIFSGEELKALVAQAAWLTVNDYEAELLMRQTGLDAQALSRLLPGGLVITRGAEGADIYQRAQGVDRASPSATTGEVVHRRLPALSGVTAVDPTGCGDALRAGLLAGLASGGSLASSVALGILLGGLKVQVRGGQNYQLSMAELRRLWAVLFGSTGDLELPAFVSNH